MAQEQKDRRSIAERLRDLLEALDKALKPTPQAPQPIPVPTRRTIRR